MLSSQPPPKQKLLPTSLYARPQSEDSDEDGSCSEGSDDDDHSDSRASEDGSASSYESETSCGTLLDQLDQEMMMGWPAASIPKAESSLLVSDKINTSNESSKIKSVESRKSPQSVRALLTALGSPVSDDYEAEEDEESSLYSRTSSSTENSQEATPKAPEAKAEKGPTLDFRKMLLRRMSQSNVSTYVQDKGYASGASSVASLGAHSFRGLTVDPAAECDATLAGAPDPNHPEEILQRLLQDPTSTTTRNSQKELEFPEDFWQSYFLPVTPARIAAYTQETASAVRSQDVPALQAVLDRQLPHASTAVLDACNAQGESLLHLAARRHNLSLLRFLHESAGCSLRVRDDCGKTVLHELSWTRTPSQTTAYFDTIVYVLQKCPELLVCRDERGFTPFHYIPKESWSVWKSFLEGRAHFIRGQAEMIRFLFAKHQLETTLRRLNEMDRVKDDASDEGRQRTR